MTQSHADSVVVDCPTADVATVIPLDPALELVRDALRGLRFGSVLVVVQDGVIVQVDRTEKRRFTNSRRQTRLSDASPHE